MATERVMDFAKRVSGEVKDFTSSKSRELAGKLQKKVVEGVERVQGVANRVASEADAKVYQAALGVVAKHFNLMTEEVERRLTTIVDVNVATPTSRSARKSSTRKTSSKQ